MTTMTRSGESTALTTLYLALELGSTRWKLAFAVTRENRPRLRTIPAGDLPALREELAVAKRRFGVTDGAPVHSCYEAGRDGFWLHRALRAQGVRNVVVDPSSIAVDRRQRRAKTDRLDVSKLVIQLMNAVAGDRRGWRELRVPSMEAEADRHLQREWQTVREDRQRIRNRLQGLLVTQGVRVRLTAAFLKRLAQARLWNGDELPPALVTRLAREWTQLRQVEARLATLRQVRAQRVAHGADTASTQARKLASVRGVGLNGALTLATEFFAWRGFTNGRQIGASVGLTPTPHRSDQIAREQGVSRSGNRRVRALSVELAWSWLRYQPRSALSRWFHQRFGAHQRARRIGIVALARKLLIALWRYLETDVMPDGATVKA